MLMHTHMHTVPVTTDRCPCRTQPACYGGGRAAAAAAAAAVEAVEEAAVAAGEKEKGYEKGYTRDGQARERQGERER